MAKFKLLAGNHMGAAPAHLPKVQKVGPDGAAEFEDGADGKPDRKKPVMVANPYHVYREGEVVETDEDLLTLNTDGHKPKFARLDSPFVTQAAAGQLGQAPVAQALPATPSNQDPAAVAEYDRTGRPAMTNSAPAAGGQAGDPGKVTTDTAAEQKAVVGDNRPAPGTVQPQKPAAPDFDRMSVQELKDYAEENEVDLGGASRKDLIVEKLKKATGAK